MRQQAIDERLGIGALCQRPASNGARRRGANLLDSPRPPCGALGAIAIETLAANTIEPVATVLQGDCLDVLRQKIPPQSVDLIFTSPPYADQRKNIYGGIHPDDYVEWFLPRAEAMRNCLKPTGSFVLNIKEKAMNGERHPYVLELILALREQGWLWVEEYVWHKKNAVPGKWTNRFRDSWERLLQFTTSKKFKMNQDAVMVPAGDWREARLTNMSDNDRVRVPSATGSGFGRRIANWEDRDWAYPTNVLHMAAECGHKNHPAVFPASLPDWFIRLFTDPLDVVLDPFAGSGTTLMAAQQLGRASIGVEVRPDYCQTIEERIRRWSYRNLNGTKKRSLPSMA